MVPIGHGWYIYLHLVDDRVNVAKYTIHGYYGVYHAYCHMDPKDTMVSPFCVTEDFWDTL